jgi:chromosome segregation ATPase
VEKSVKQLKKQNKDLSHELDDSKRYVEELLSQKSKYQNDVHNLTAQLDEAETLIRGFSHVRDQLQTQIEESKRRADEESRAREKLASKVAELESRLAKHS